MQPPSAAACFARLETDFLQRLLQRLERVLREDGVLVAQQVVGVNFGAEHELDTGRLREPRYSFSASLRLLSTSSVVLPASSLLSAVRKSLVLASATSKFSTMVSLPSAIFEAMRRAERAHQLLLRERVLVAAGLRSVDRTAATPERSTDRTDTSAARALLLPQLLAGAGDQLAVLGGGSSLTERGAVVLDRLPEQRFVDFAREDLVGEFELSDLVPPRLTTLMFAIFLLSSCRDRCGGPKLCILTSFNTSSFALTAVFTSSSKVQPSWKPSMRPWLRRRQIHDAHAAAPLPSRSARIHHAVRVLRLRPG